MNQVGLATAAGFDRRRHHAPALDELCGTVTAALAADGPEGLWACEGAFRALVGSAFLTDVVASELAQMVEDPAHLPAGGGSEADLALVVHPSFTLAVKLLVPANALSDRLCGSAQHALMAAVGLGGTGSVGVERFEQRAADPRASIEHLDPLTPVGTCTLRPGDAVTIRAAVDVFRILPVAAPALLLFLATDNVVPVRVEYDREGLQPIRAIAASVDAPRLEFAARMLSEIGDADSVASLRELVGHDDHFVRWAAVRSVTRLDALAGRELVVACLDDRHPHVRNAAARALPAIDAAVAARAAVASAPSAAAG